MLRRFLGKIKKLLQSPFVLCSPSDWFKFALLDDRLPVRQQVRLRVKSFGGKSVICRNGTTDANVLWGIIREKYHLPDVPLPPRSCILDLGANAGYSMAHFASLYPDAKVVGVEMDTDNYELACENTRAFGQRCVLVHAAISSTNGTLTYGGDRADGFRLLPEDAAVGAVKKVRALTLESFCQEASLDKIDFLKMDIEGAEREVFSSDLSWLSRVYHLKVEVHNRGDFDLIQGALAGAGFDCAKDKHHWSALVATRKAGFRATSESTPSRL